MRKSLALLFVASVAIACSDGSSGKKGGRFDRFTDNLTALGRGTVIQEHRSGQSFILENGVARVNNVNERIESIVLKVEGANYYALETSTDGGDTSRSVRLKKLLTTADLQGPAGGGTLNGDILTFSFTDQDTDWEIKMRTQIRGQINLANPYCDLKYESVISDAWYLHDGARTNLPDVTQDSETHCARSLSNAELKALDLKNIEFCDETTGDDYQCHGEADLSRLTADL